MIPLSSIARCFEGIVPASITTCSRDGIPNLATVSQVHHIDARHVALSRQFFNKTTRNLLENPRAQVTVWDPISFEVFALSIRYLRSETTGPLFESMSARIEAIAGHTGMKGIFKLQAAEIFEVLDVFAITGHLDPPDPAAAVDDGKATDELTAQLNRPPEAREELWILQRISLRMNQAVDLDDLLGCVLESLAEDFGFAHAQVLLLDETGRRLFTVASRGYDQSGVGSEVVFGEGLIGTVARDRRLVRVGHLEAEMRYCRTARASVSDRPGQAQPEIPLAGLPDAQSLMAVPLLVQDKLVGVLAIESRERHAFEAWHEAFLGVVANQVAANIQRLAQAEPAEEPSHARSAAAAPKPAAPAGARRRRQLVFYQNDDCVFADGEYLIRNVPGRILWKILKAYVQEARTELTNRELRLDPSLGLPAIKDNLESRLILLRKRLEQKCPDIRLPSRGRGRFGIEVDSDLALCEKPFS
jgi:adenylate cyclase